jgi:hypothetical protein
MDRKQIVAGMALLAVAGSCAAAEPGFYFAAGIGQTEQDVSPSAGTTFAIGSPFGGVIMRIAPDSVNVDDDELSWNGTVGYRINKYVAAELAYMDFGAADVSERYTIPPFSIFPATQFTQQFTIGVTGPAVSVLGSLPLGAGFDIFARGGVLFADQEVTLRGTINSQSMTFGSEVWLGGAGIDWSFANRWAARLEYTRTGDIEENLISGESDLSQFALSVLFRL